MRSTTGTHELMSGPRLLNPFEFRGGKQMDNLIARLEGAVTRLEVMAGGNLKTEVKCQDASQGAFSERPGNAAHAALDTISYLDFEKLLDQLPQLIETAKEIGEDVSLASTLFVEAFMREKIIVEALIRCKEPSNPSELASILSPVAEKVSQLGEVARNQKPGETAHPLHFKILEEAAQSLNWVAYSGPNCGLSPPPQHVEDVIAATQFYINRLRMQHPKSASNSAWISSIVSFMNSLKEYCQKHHAVGPLWNDTPSGMELKDFKPGNSEAIRKPEITSKPGARPAPPPPPPPPLPSASSLTQPRTQSSANSEKQNVAALFAEINRGELITSGLRKVTDDMKIKNRNERSRETVPSHDSNRSTDKINQNHQKQDVDKSLQRLECEQGRKWVVENYVGDGNIRVGPTNPRQSVYIFNCQDCTISVQGKVNAVTIDACTRCGILIETVVASCEIVNSRKVEVQATGSLPTVCIDSTDGCRIYLTKTAALETDITSSKSSEMNVVILGDVETQDAEEYPLPEHFVSKFKGKGKGFLTQPVVHGA